MTFIPEVAIHKSGNRLTVIVKQRYKARGFKVAHRWVIAGVFSLKELDKLKKE